MESPLDGPFSAQHPQAQASRAWRAGAHQGQAPSLLSVEMHPVLTSRVHVGLGLPLRALRGVGLFSLLGTFLGFKNKYQIWE